YPDFQTVLRRQMHLTGQEQPRQAPITNNQTFFIGLVSILSALLAFRKLAPKFAELLNQKADLSSAAAAAAEIQAEYESYSNFASTFKGGPEGKLAKEAAAEDSSKRRTASETFLELAPEKIESIRTLFAQVSRAADQ